MRRVLGSLPRLLLPVGPDDQGETMMVGEKALLHDLLEVTGVRGQARLQLGHDRGKLQRGEGIETVHPSAQRATHETQGIG